MSDSMRKAQMAYDELDEYAPPSERDRLKLQLQLEDKRIELEDLTESIRMIKREIEQIEEQLGKWSPA